MQADCSRCAAFIFVSITIDTKIQFFVSIAIDTKIHFLYQP
jgi:hypothetical protein